MRSLNTKNAIESSETSLLRSTSFRKRVLTGALLFAALYAIYRMGPLYVMLTFAAVTVGLTVEWANLVRKSLRTPGRQAAWFLGGLVYFVLGMGGLSIIFWHNPLLGYLAFITVVITDTGAFFVGKKLGGPKLWPAVSPNKTWSGSVGGYFISQLHVLLFCSLYPPENLLTTLLFTSLISITGQIGDLLESSLKRALNVKDSGTILPGHGGLFDRFDGQLAAGLVILALYLFNLCP